MIEHHDFAGCHDVAVRLGEAMRAGGQSLSLAESCTGGLAAAVITDVAGSSAWFDRGFVAYSHTSKLQMLGVSLATLDAHGSVSETTVAEMARGALLNSDATVAVAISGVAGPGGGSVDKPVGMVCLAWALSEACVETVTLYFTGERSAVRCQSVEAALLGLLDRLQS